MSISIFRQKARDVFELRFSETIDPDRIDGSYVKVAGPKDVVQKLSEPGHN